MHSIFLYLAGGDFGETRRWAEERKKVNAETNTMTLDPPGAALAFGDNFVFFQKLCRGVFKGLFCFSGYLLGPFPEG